MKFRISFKEEDTKQDIDIYGKKNFISIPNTDETEYYYEMTFGIIIEKYFDDDEHCAINLSPIFKRGEGLSFAEDILEELEAIVSIED